MARRYKDAPSILQDEKECFLSGTLEGLERHHIYGGANRRNSAKYGLWVWLRHDLHNEPPDGVHFNSLKNERVQQISCEDSPAYRGGRGIAHFLDICAAP